MKRAEANVDFRLFYRIVVQYSNAVFFACKSLVLNFGEHLFKAVGSCNGLKLAASDKPLSIRTNVNAVRAFTTRNQENQAGGLFGIDDFYATDVFRFSGLNGFLYFLP